MAYDVARVRGLHPALGDGWTRFDSPAGMAVPEAVASAVATAFRGCSANVASPHPAAQRSAAMLHAARRAIADLLNANPGGVVLGADRAVLLGSLADASSTRTGLGNEVVVSRLGDEANIAPWLRAANRFGATVKWADIEIETGELPMWQWEELLTPDTRLVAIPSASSTLGSVVDVRSVVKLAHEVGAFVVADHSAAAPFRLFDIASTEADVVAVNAAAWGGPPIGALVFRNPALIDTLGSVSTNLYASGAARLELGAHQYGLLGGVVASVEYLAGLDEGAQGSRSERLSQSMESATKYLDGLLEYLMTSLQSMSMVEVIGAPTARIPVVSIVVTGVPAERVVHRLADNGVLAIGNAASRALDALGVDEIGGAVTLGLGHYSTVSEIDHLVRTLASLG